MSGSRSRLVLLLAGILLAALAVSLWRIATPTPTPAVAARPEPETPPSSPSGAAPDIARPETRIESRPREPLEDRGAPAPFAAGGAADSAGESGKIEGRVLRRDGTPAAASTLVIARAPEDLRGDFDLVERVRRRDTSLPTARTDSDGSFVLGDLPSGSSYVLIAAGRGAFSTQSTPAIAEGTTGVRIGVSQIYGIAVELREVGGGPLRTRYGPRAPQLATSSATTFPDTPLLELAGVDLSPYRAGPNQRLFLFTSPQEAEPPAIERVPLRFRLIGYSPADVLFDALPILPAIPQHPVELRPTVAGWSEIVLEFREGRDPTTDGPRVHPFRLLISSSTGPQAEIELPSEPGPKRLLGIPFARYRVSVLNALEQEIYPRPGSPVTPLAVVAAPATLAVSLAETAELEIRIQGRDGRRYEGGASFTLVGGAPSTDGKSIVGRAAQVIFDHAPYVLGALLPGHYELIVQEPADAVVLPAGSGGLFDLEAGIGKTVTLALD